MDKLNFTFNPLGCYAKIYHDLAKKYRVQPTAIKILLNSVYGNNLTRFPY